MKKIRFTFYKIKVITIFYIKYKIIDKIRLFIYHNFKKKNMVVLTDVKLQSIIEETSKNGKSIGNALKEIKRRLEYVRE